MDWTRRLRLQHLQLLVSLMETGNLSGTARAAHTTQPGLSKWLKELEEDVGAPLFERHARGLRPTPYGMTLFNHAQRVLTEMERARQNLEAMRSGSGSRVLLGTSPASAPSLVPRALRAFLGRYPGAQVELLEGTMNGLLERLEKRQLDVVVGRLDNYAPRASLRCEVLYSEAIVVMARPGHPLAQAAALDWEDVRRYDWIVWPPGSPIRSKLDMALTQGGRQPPAYRLESSSMLANIELLRGSDMLSIGSARVVEHLAGLGLVARLALEIPGEGAVGMCWRDEPHRDRASEDLLACLREGAAAEQGAGRRVLLQKGRGFSTMRFIIIHVSPRLSHVRPDPSQRPPSRHACAVQRAPWLVAELVARQAGLRGGRGGPGPGHLPAHPAQARTARDRHAARVPADHRPRPGDRPLASRGTAARLPRKHRPPARGTGAVARGAGTGAGTAGGNLADARRAQAEGPHRLPPGPVRRPQPPADRRTHGVSQRSVERYVAEALYHCYLLRYGE